MDEPEPTTRRQSRRVTVPPSTHNLRDLRDARVCETCRKLKIKCSGDKPCTWCTQKGTTCEYDEPPRQSGRAAASTSNAGRKRPAPTSSYAQIKESRQRKRAAAAQTSCDFCRNDLRRKCDGLRPSCQSCIKRGVTCVYSGPASVNSSVPTTTAPTPLIPQASTVTASDDGDSDIIMGSRSGSPDIPLADASQGNPKPPYPLGNGLGHAGSTRNPDGTNCTRPVACFFCIQVELPCTGDFPTCVNCIRRNRSCSYPDPSSYAHQFPRQSAIHSRQLKDPSRGLTSPGKSLSPGKVPSRGSFDSSSRGVLDPSPRGILEPSSTLRGILDPTTPTRGVLDTSRGILDVGAPRSAIEARGTLDAPQPMLHPSRSLPGPLNQHRSAQPPATPTPPSMSVSPDPSSETSNIRVVNPSTNANGSHSRQHSSDLSRSASHAELRTPRSSDTFRHIQTPPQSQSSDRDRDRRSTSALSGVLGDLRGPQTPGGSANLGGILVSPSGRTRDGASMMGLTGPIVTKERVDGFVNEGPASYRAKIENAANQSPRPNIQPSTAQVTQQSPRSTNPQPSVQQSPRPSAPQTPSAPLQQSPNAMTQQSPNTMAQQLPRPTNQSTPTNQQLHLSSAPAPGSQSPNAPTNQSSPQQHPPRRDSTADQTRAQPSAYPVQVSNAGSPRRGSNPPTAPRSMTSALASIALPPRPPQPLNQEGHYETGRDLVIGRARGQGEYDWRARSGSGSGSAPGRYERERERRDERDRDWRDDRRDSLPDRRDSMEWREPLPDRRDSLSRREPPLDRDRPEREWPPMPPNWRSSPPHSHPLPSKSGSPPGSSARAGSGGNSPRGTYLRAESRSSPMDMDSS